jgi:hypothetical protein
MDVCVLLQAKTKRKMQDYQGKATSTDEVQTEYKRITKNWWQRDFLHTSKPAQTPTQPQGKTGEE